MMAELLLAWVLGFKHGLDADHLALIDNLGRALRDRSPGTARLAGLLFSLGHSLAVFAMTLMAVLIGQRYGKALPAWLEGTGALLAAGTLILLAGVNLRSLYKVQARRTDSQEPARGFGRFMPRSGRLAALGVAALGALFALSFDTMTQAALFAGLGHQGAQPVLAAAALSALFGLGMICSDTVNGLVVNRLLDHLARRSGNGPLAGDVRQRALNFMTLSLAVLSLLVAAIALARLLDAPGVRALEGHELGLGLAVIGWVLCSYAVAAWMSWQGRRGTGLGHSA